MGHLAIHDTVVHLLSKEKRGELLDVPAGEGALAERLRNIGFHTNCCDLYPELFRVPGVEIAQGDLSRELPYQAGSFQFVTCIEGLEHLENPTQAIREFRRVLKPGGQLVVSVPNIMNIEERLKWLIYGYTSHFKPLSREFLEGVQREYGSRKEIALHIHPLGYSELRFLLEDNGFEVPGVYRDQPKKHMWAYWPIVGIIRLLGRMAPSRRRRERWTVQLQSDEVLLGGNTLILRAVKVQ